VGGRITSNIRDEALEKVADTGLKAAMRREANPTSQTVGFGIFCFQNQTN
jgi:hypothetical protein